MNTVTRAAKGAVTLQEQMGAMAIIDDLRHRQMLVQEHLDLPARRREVASKVRAYYDAKGIEVTDELVSTGVAEYFSGRLSYFEPKISPFAKRLANLYITRDQWLGTAVSLGMGLAFVVVIIALSIYAIGHGERQNTLKMLQTVFAETQASEQNVSAQLSQLRARADRLKLAPAQSMLNQIEPEFKVVSPMILAAKVDPSIQDVDSKLLEINANAGKKMATLEAQVKDVERLLTATERVRSVVAAADTEKILKDFPGTADKLMAFERTVDGAGFGNVHPSVVAANAFVGATEAVARIDPLARRKADLDAAVNAMRLNAEDQAVWIILSERATEKLAKMDVAGADTAVGEMQKTHDFAKRPLKIQIVDKVGVKSGVERNYNASGGKSWYLVAEAINQVDEPVLVSIKSAETGATKSVRMFGVRVSKDEYERVKADKLADGIVNQREIGVKPANALQMRFNNRVGSAPEMITEW